MKNLWLDRTLFVCPIYYTLCTTEKDFQRELKRLDVDRQSWPAFMASKTANASVHFLENEGKTCAIVCIAPIDRDPVEVAGLLVHEAVHIWQEARDDVGERSPSSEFEAYAIQHIAQNLMAEYRRQVFN